MHFVLRALVCSIITTSTSTGYRRSDRRDIKLQYCGNAFRDTDEDRLQSQDAVDHKITTDPAEENYFILFFLKAIPVRRSRLHSIQITILLYYIL